jgi:putative transposase
MPYRNTNLASGEFYHLYNRGNNKQIIFHNNDDRHYFQHLLFSLNTDKNSRVRNKVSSVADDKDRIVSIGAYCLMPNHFHILVKQEKDNGISLFMKKVLTAYVMYFNIKYSRTGGLFEGRFKSKHANSDNYLKYLYAYIHLNPIKINPANWSKDSDYKKAENFKFVTSYYFSSLQDYLGITREESVILSKEAFPEYFLSSSDVIKNLKVWIDLKDRLQ